MKEWIDFQLAIMCLRIAKFFKLFGYWVISGYFIEVGDKIRDKYISEDELVDPHKKLDELDN